MNNQERNEQIKEKITSALIEMLKTKRLEEIQVKELVEVAGVGRVSFYRNYESLRDVLRKYSQSLLDQVKPDKNASVDEVFEQLFQHYKDNESYYLLLYQNQLMDLIMRPIIHNFGPKEDMSDERAFRHSFISFGISGWAIEWMKRGMKEVPKSVNEVFPNGFVL